MKTVRIVCVLAAVLATGPAVAFQEQTQGQGGAQVAPPPRASEAPVSSTPLQVAPQGTEVRVPGFGRLGVLPKMDFGLELLYGASEPRQIPVPPQVDDADNLSIRGSVKHKF